MAEFETKELSPQTWADFERFFSQGHGWDHCGCNAYHGIRAPRELRKWADRRDWNLRVKCDLVESGLSQGVLVYDDGEPVGWCQFGRARELRIFPASAHEDAWRITCFCTHRRWRGRGVSAAALAAALDAIARTSGGLVQACPVVTIPPDPGLDELIAAEGGDSPQVDDYLKATTGASSVTYYDKRPFAVAGVALGDLGPVTALVRRMAGALHPGTVAMFERAGFVAMKPLPARGKLGTTRVVMERVIPRRRRRAEQ